nr:rcc01693 family protein [Chelatococcus sp.]
MAAGRPEAGPSPVPLPWDAAMAFGLGVLRLVPADFWGMTPREFAAAVKGLTGRNLRSMPLDRARLAQLMAAFPDQTRSQYQEEQ